MSEQTEVKRERLQERISLVNLNRGAAVQLFNAELEKVIKNIADPNTAPMAARTITLKVKITPNNHRNNAETSVACSSSLAGYCEHKDAFALELDDNGKLTAMHNFDRDQMALL